MIPQRLINPALLLLALAATGAPCEAPAAPRSQPSCATEPNKPVVTLSPSADAVFKFNNVTANVHNEGFRIWNIALLGSKFSHQVYATGEPLAAKDVETTGMRVVGNEFRTSGSCSGVRVVVHGRHSNFLIENNLVYTTDPGPGCYAIGAGPGGYPPDQGPYYFHELNIRRNRIIGPGNGNTPISVAACQDCRIESNLIEFTIRNGGSAIRVPGEAARPGVDLPNTRTIIENNTIYATSAGSATGIAIGTEGDGYVVANNAVFATAPDFSCLSVTRPTAFIGNNFCRQPRGLDRTAVFVDAPADFTPVVGSPLVGAGKRTCSSPVAIRTVPWTATDGGKRRGASPDIGAFQR